MRAVCDGLVLRESEYGENDKILVVLTAEYGKIMLTAKGARSMRSKSLPLCHLFTYANFEYYEKNGRRWLSGGSVNDSFFGLNGDIQGFALAAYIVQLAAEITGEGVPCPEVLRMTLNTLYAIENKLKPLPLIKSAYEIFAANVSGFTPDISGCAVCDRETIEGDLWLDVMNGRILCAECLSEQSRGAPIPSHDELMTQNILMPLDASSLAAWRYVTDAPLKRILAFAVTNADSLSMLSRASEAYIVNHLERSFETLDFYHTVKEE